MARKRTPKRNDSPARVTLQALVDSVAANPPPEGWYTLAQLAKHIRCSETHTRRRIEEFGVETKLFRPEGGKRAVIHYYFPIK
jgi:AraC-like DNA-binding protein